MLHPTILHSFARYFARRQNAGRASRVRDYLDILNPVPSSPALDSFLQYAEQFRVDDVDSCILPLLVEGGPATDWAFRYAVAPRIIEALVHSRRLSKYGTRWRSVAAAPLAPWQLRWLARHCGKHLDFRIARRLMAIERGFGSRTSSGGIGHGSSLSAAARRDPAIVRMLLTAFRCWGTAETSLALATQMRASIVARDCDALKRQVEFAVSLLRCVPSNQTAAIELFYRAACAMMGLTVDPEKPLNASPAQLMLRPVADTLAQLGNYSNDAAVNWLSKIAAVVDALPPKSAARARSAWGATTSDIAGPSPFGGALAAELLRIWLDEPGDAHNTASADLLDFIGESDVADDLTTGVLEQVVDHIGTESNSKLPKVLEALCVTTLSDRGRVRLLVAVLRRQHNERRRLLMSYARRAPIAREGRRGLVRRASAAFAGADDTPDDWITLAWESLLSPQSRHPCLAARWQYHIAAAQLRPLTNEMLIAATDFRVGLQNMDL